MNIYEVLDDQEIDSFEAFAQRSVITNDEYKVFRLFVTELVHDDKQYWLNLGWSQVYEHFLRQFQH